MGNGINQSVELRILGANTTDFSCGNYGGGGLDAVADIQFFSNWACTDKRTAMRLTVITGIIPCIVDTYKLIKSFEGFNTANTVQVSR
jgi:hypothetical protein